MSRKEVSANDLKFWTESQAKEIISLLSASECHCYWQSQVSVVEVLPLWSINYRYWLTLHCAPKQLPGAEK